MLLVRDALAKELAAATVASPAPRPPPPPPPTALAFPGVPEQRTSSASSNLPQAPTPPLGAGARSQGETVAEVIFSGAAFQPQQKPLPAPQPPGTTARKWGASARRNAP
jgi:hypothetical protein